MPKGYPGRTQAALDRRRHKAREAYDAVAPEERKKRTRTRRAEWTPEQRERAKATQKRAYVKRKALNKKFAKCVVCEAVFSPRNYQICCTSACSKIRHKQVSKEYRKTYNRDHEPSRAMGQHKAQLKRIEERRRHAREYGAIVRAKAKALCALGLAEYPKCVRSNYAEFSRQVRLLAKVATELGL